jgi:hypothetical protein
MCAWHTAHRGVLCAVCAVLCVLCTQAGARDTALLANPDVPVTIYSEAVASKTYGGTFSGTAALNGASPFGKATNFSKPMGDYSKVVIDE